MSYDAMSRRVSSIAGHLLEVGLSPGNLVGVLQEPSAEWICSMLAIWRVGATYLPLDLRNSTHRAMQAVRAAKPRALVIDWSTLEVANTLAAEDKAVTLINVSDIVPTGSASHRENLCRADAPAVVLFTSGTTAVPKGILVTHANLVAQNEGFSRQCDVPGGGVSKVLQQSALSFDFSLEQTLLALCNGGCLYIVPSKSRGDPFEVTRLMKDEGITYTSGTPSEYAMWFQYGRAHLRDCIRWRNAFFGGEAFTDDFIREFRTLDLSDLRVFNNYGPGETTIACTHQGEIQYRDVANPQYPLPAGFPAPNYAVYVVDERLNLLPVGVPGEIVVGGAGVTAGYLDLNKETRAKFLPDAYSGDDENFAKNGWTTMYRTGDRGRLREDGAVLVEGRMDGDTQVKLRGFRIELREVEAAVVDASAGALSHAIVTLRESGSNGDGAKFLAAHVVFSRHHNYGGESDRSKFLADLQAKLPVPDYMRPAVMVPLESLPLTAHSKADRAAINALDIELNPGASDASAVSTRELTNTEAALAQLWRGILPFKAALPIAPDTNFFHIGGSSLLLVKLQRLIKQEFRAAPKLIELMNASRLAEMAAVITAALSARIIWDVETAIPESWAHDFLPVATPDKPPRAADHGLKVLLTGATGYLGRHLVPALVTSDKLAKLVCLVRHETDASSLQAVSASGKIELVRGDLGEPNLGLEAAEFDRLASETDVILHSGANRSFWDDYEVLRPVNVSSVKELARLALRRRVPLHFLSSGSTRIYSPDPDGARTYNDNTTAAVAAGGQEDNPTDPCDVATAPPDDGTDGYVASKWAAERFLHGVAARFRLPVTLHTPVPVPGLGPSAAGAEPETDEMLAELIDITRRLAVRPTMTGLDGWADIMPTSTVVDDVCAAVLGSDAGGTEGTGESGDSQQVVLSRVSHTGRRRINWRRFIDELKANPELAALPTMPTLLWIGQAKRSGYSYFMPAHRLVVLSEQGDMVSRR